MAHRFLKLSLVCMAIIASTDLKAQQAPQKNLEAGQ